MDLKSKFSDLVELMVLLRSPQGCPWDREQTPQSIKANILEEACEVMDALDTGDKENIKEELGDLLLQVIFQSQLAAEIGQFTIDDVIDGIVAKLKRRHPHIFGDLKLETATEVLNHWELIKAGEKEEYGRIDNVPKSLPALAMAQKLQKKAAKSGFDWPNKDGVLEKLSEETAEFFAVADNDPRSREEEFGDILFTLANLARHLGVESETALRRANNKFRRRFSIMADLAQDRGDNLNDLTLEQMEELWQAAKRN
ncbi:MAG TPA: nucleoside triphosphate pyrophosphohydrolase [Actinobacteria bacterium]|nr:nucleoside triphosphate pyrophosphohydrolase [Actinomycetes bacterium]HEX21507.1 nucleoside triphosphate pyrophosphohydrolase [Actinomycetota bacterium]